MISSVFKYLGENVVMRHMAPIGGWYMRVSPRMITCREFNDFIYDHVEGALTEKEETLFTRHMGVCPMCRNFLRTYIAAYMAKDEVLPYSDIDVPDVVPQGLIDAIFEVRENRKYEA